MSCVGYFGAIKALLGFVLLVSLPRSSFGFLSLPHSGFSSFSSCKKIPQGNTAIPITNFSGDDFSRSSIQMNAQSAAQGRADFLKVSSTVIATGLLLEVSPEAAEARGRATLEQAYDRYTPRIIAGGKFYANDLKQMIAKGDWAGVKAATSDPPKRTKADLAKQDGGIAERAAQAGGFSDARVLVAADLFAATFSDNSISQKTKNMKEQVEGMRKTVEGLNLAARQALGEAKPEGGIFGIGAKAPSKAELANRIKQLYIDGGNYYNQYVYAANEGLPVTFTKLSYL